MAAGDTGVLADVRRVTRMGEDYTPTDARQLCSLILHTCYMGTGNSSQTTRDRAAALADEIGAHHIPATIDPMIKGILQVLLPLPILTAFPGDAPTSVGGHPPPLPSPPLTTAPQVFKELTSREPKFKNQGGTLAEDLALQNIQARSRMVFGYMLAQLLP